MKIRIQGKCFVWTANSMHPNWIIPHHLPIWRPYSDYFEKYFIEIKFHEIFIKNIDFRKMFTHSIDLIFPWNRYIIIHSLFYFFKKIRAQYFDSCQKTFGNFFLRIPIIQFWGTELQEFMIWKHQHMSFYIQTSYKYLISLQWYN